MHMFNLHSGTTTHGSSPAGTSTRTHRVTPISAVTRFSKMGCTNSNVGLASCSADADMPSSDRKMVMSFSANSGVPNAGWLMAAAAASGGRAAVAGGGEWQRAAAG